jgi:hypothetical protein
MQQRVGSAMPLSDKPGAGALIRLAGLGLILLAVAAGYAMLYHAVWPGHVLRDALTYLLAAITFLAATGGIAMLVMGRQLLDRIEVPSPWLPLNWRDR